MTLSRIWRSLSSSFLMDREISTVDAWAMRHQHRCSPDDIITAAIIQSIASNPDDWQFSGQLNYALSYVGHYSQNATLTNKKKKIVITFIFEGYAYKDKGKSYVQAKYRACGCSVNGVELSHAHFKSVIRSWEALTSKLKAAKDAADKAKSEMDRNEQAWNIAESLLGMKRNEHGALVPVKEVE
jgi:hypothetical protein